MSEPQTHTLAQTVLLALEHHEGGLDGALRKLEQSGLASAVQSWITTGANAQVGPQQVHNALPGAVNAVAARLGIAPPDAAAKISQILPQLVDHLTPAGQKPAGGFGGFGELAKGLQGFLQ